MNNATALLLLWTCLALQFLLVRSQIVTSGLLSARDGSSLGSDSTPCFSGPAASFSTSCFYAVSCWPTSWTDAYGLITALPSSALCPSSLNACETTTVTVASGLGHLSSYDVHCGIPSASGAAAAASTGSFTSGTDINIIITPGGSRSSFFDTGSVALASTLSSYPPLPSYTGGDLLRGYCATPEFTLLYGPQSTVVYYAAFVGCVNDKPDCCPFTVSTATSTTTDVVIATAAGTRALTTSFLTFISPNSSIPSSQTSLVGIASRSSVIVSTVVTVVVTSTPVATDTSSSTPTPQPFPTAVSEAQSTLSGCPGDYHMVSSSCCPSGYSLWTAALGGVTPCYSVLPTPLNVTAPPPSGLSTESGGTITLVSNGTLLTSPPVIPTTVTALITTTSICTDVYWSIPYPVQDQPGSKLPTGAIVAIGVVSGLMASALAFWFIVSRWLRKKKPHLEGSEKSSLSSFSSSSSLNFEDYTVAWIAPLEIEALAAVYMLDHVHKGNFGADRGDDYVYTAGDINGHNVIIATFPAGHSYGVGSAAALASQVKTRFPNLWFGLLVGVAAGLPSADPPRDIRLGDVLVGEGEHGSAGLVSYGFGKETSAGFQYNRVEPKTAMLVGSAITAIKILGPGHEDVFLQYYEDIKDREHNDGGTFADPGQAKDRLYSTVNETCPVALPILRRKRLSRERTKVWYGKIGSGDKLMKNGQKRDELRRSFPDLIGLEMEAAGIMSTIPVGVIRGVCDYADEYKNKKWQPYAAAMAAAYANALLYKIDTKTRRREGVARS